MIIEIETVKVTFSLAQIYELKAEIDFVKNEVPDDPAVISGLAQLSAEFQKVLNLLTDEK